MTADAADALEFWMTVFEEPVLVAAIFSLVVIAGLLLALYIRFREGGTLVYRSRDVVAETKLGRGECPPEASLYSHGVLVTYPTGQGGYNHTHLRRVRLPASDRADVLALLGVPARWDSLVRRQRVAIPLRTVDDAERVHEIPLSTTTSPEPIRARLLAIAERDAARSRVFSAFSYAVRLVPTPDAAGRRLEEWTLDPPIERFGHDATDAPASRCRVVNDIYAPSLVRAVCTPDLQSRQVYLNPTGGYFEVAGRALLDDEIFCACGTERDDADSAP